MSCLSLGMFIIVWNCYCQNIFGFMDYIEVIDMI